MTDRRHGLWAGALALLLFGVAYMLAWSVVRGVPPAERDGLEWVYVGLLAFPWSLFAGAGGWPIVHVGAAANAALIALLAAWTARRRSSRG